MKPAPGQRDLFGGGQSALPQYDAPVNASVPKDDAARIANQQSAILARMLRGPAPGPELGQIAARYSARLGELRDAGKIAGWLKRPIGGGQFEYRLIGREEPCSS